MFDSGKSSGGKVIWVFFYRSLKNRILQMKSFGMQDFLWIFSTSKKGEVSF